MAINSTHPSFEGRIYDWRMMRDAYEGERAVKARTVVYLPATPSQILDGMGSNKPNSVGEANYKAYLMRAVFPDYVKDAVEHYIGMLHQKPATIELPDAMLPLMERATNQGESLLDLLRRINTEQMTTGRLGLLVDMPPNPDASKPLPYIAIYCTESIINWDDSADNIGVNSLELVVLDETGPVRREDFTWVDEERYRVLMMAELNEANQSPAEPLPEGEAAPALNPDSVVTVRPTGTRIYKQALYINKSNQTAAAIDMTPPVLRGKALEQIPFVFINTKDVVSAPDAPPLLGLGRLAMTIYRGEADYRQALFMQGQDTLVTIGGIIDPETGANKEGAGALTEDGVRVGAGARIDLNMGGDAKYIGVSSTGLSEMRSALENDRKLAETKSGQLIAPAAGKQESGDAMSTRISAQTVSLHQIAKAGAKGLENALRIIAEWLGLDPEKVKVEPNLEFVDKVLAGKELVDLMTARTLGAPLALETIHKTITARGLSDLTFEEEMALIEDEDLAGAKRSAKVAALLPQPEPGSGGSGPAGGGGGGAGA